MNVAGRLEERRHDGSNMVLTVVKIKGHQDILDANHPLAVKTLLISAQVLEVRAASAEEIGHGHVHGAHGHQH